MAAKLFILLTFLTSQPDIQIQVAEGDRDTVPSWFIELDELEKHEIGQSYWAKVTIKSQYEADYILQGGNWYMRNIDFYDVDHRLIGSGNNIKVNLRKGVPTYFFLFYQFADEKDKNLFSITIEPLEKFLERESIKNAFQVAFLSILAFPLIIALFFSYRTKEIVYLYYALYILSVIIFFGYQYGITGALLPIVDNIRPMWFWLLAFTITLFYALFSMAFLSLKERDLLAYKIIRLGIYYMIGLFLLSSTLYLLKIDAQHSYFYKIPAIVIQLGLIGFLILRVFSLKGRLKNYFLVGAFVLIAISITGQIMSTIQSVGNFNYIIQAGLILEVLILSVGLGVRVDLIQKAKSATQLELIHQLQVNEQFQKEYTDKLELEVSRRTEDLVERNKENELLLKEVHHRVKNNLQMITSLLNMQERRSKTEGAKQLINAVRGKIKSIALIHEHLYLKEDFSKVKLNEYIHKLIQMIISSLHKGKSLDLNLHIEEFNADIELAIPIGLIVNELVTNSLKYGMDDAFPQLTVNLTKSENQMILLVQDNGDGLEEEKIQFGLGITIVRAILSNHKGTMEMKNQPNGFSVISVFNEF